MAILGEISDLLVHGNAASPGVASLPHTETQVGRALPDLDVLDIIENQACPDISEVRVLLIAIVAQPAGTPCKSTSSSLFPIISIHQPAQTQLFTVTHTSNRLSFDFGLTERR